MDIIFPKKVRATIYVLVVLGTAIVVPLDAANAIPDLAAVIWNSIAGAASALAALNIAKNSK